MTKKVDFKDVPVGKKFEMNGKEYTKVVEGKYRKWGRGGKTYNAQSEGSGNPDSLFGSLVSVKVIDK